MKEDDFPKSIGSAAISATLDIGDELIGSLDSFVRLREFLDDETAHLPDFVVDRIKTAVTDFHKVCESHIEVIALAKMMATNVAAEGKAPTYPIALRERAAGNLVVISPQVDLPPYRADFFVTRTDGSGFVFECDGQAFHDRKADKRRDADIERAFGLKTMRVTGSSIWKSDSWLPKFRKLCLGDLE